MAKLEGVKEVMTESRKSEAARRDQSNIQSRILKHQSSSPHLLGMVRVKNYFGLLSN